MTEEQLQTVKERAEKATDGPWLENIGNPFNWEYSTVTTKDGKTIGKHLSDTDAEFIAASRQDIPQLVAEVERLREGLETIANHNIFKVPQIMMRDYAREVLEGKE